MHLEIYHHPEMRYFQLFGYRPSTRTNWNKTTYTQWQMYVIKDGYINSCSCYSENHFHGCKLNKPCTLCPVWLSVCEFCGDEYLEAIISRKSGTRHIRCGKQSCAMRRMFADRKANNVLATPNKRATIEGQHKTQETIDGTQNER
jgi:hypothetical protein